MKGKPDLRVPSKQGRDNYSKIKWESTYLCQQCRQEAKKLIFGLCVECAGEQHEQ